MADKHVPVPADFIVPMNISGLEGRLLHLPIKNDHKREILFVYGHHSTLERWWGLMQALNEYGSVTMPDLPGFGGMDSFYKVGRKPTLDNMADYLAAFIKWRYKRKKVTIAGMSFGFLVATRMLQRFPELTNKVDMLVSIVGFAHHDDFIFSQTRYRFYRYGSGLFTGRISSKAFRYLGLNRYVLRAAYSRTNNAKHKFATVASQKEFDDMMDMEINLWHKNDVRTHWFTTVEMLTADNCSHGQIDLPVWHISTENDHFFDHTVVEQHMRIIFKDFHPAPAQMPNHAPSVIADAEAAAPLIPEVLRQALRQPLA